MAEHQEGDHTECSDSIAMKHLDKIGISASSIGAPPFQLSAEFCRSEKVNGLRNSTTEAVKPQPMKGAPLQETEFAKKRSLPPFLKRKVR